MYSIVDKGVSVSAKVKINDERAKRDYGEKKVIDKQKSQYEETFSI